MDQTITVKVEGAGGLETGSGGGSKVGSASQSPYASALANYTKQLEKQIAIMQVSRKVLAQSVGTPAGLGAFKGKNPIKDIGIPMLEFSKASKNAIKTIKGGAPGTEAGIKGLPLMLGRMGRIINETAKGGIGGGVKLTAMLGGILFIGSVLTKAMKPIFKMMDILSTILGAALMPIAMIFFNLLRPLLYILLPLVRFMWNIWRPIQRQMAESLKKSFTENPNMTNEQKSATMLDAALTAGGQFFFTAIAKSLEGIGNMATGGALGNDPIGNAIKLLVGTVVALFVLPAGLASIGGAISGLFTAVSLAFGESAVMAGTKGTLAGLSKTIGLNINNLMGAVAGYFIADKILSGVDVDKPAKDISTLLITIAGYFALTNPIIAAALVVGAGIALLVGTLLDRIAKSIEDANNMLNTPAGQAAISAQKVALNQMNLGGKQSMTNIGGNITSGYGLGLSGNLSNMGFTDPNSLNIGNQTNNITINAPSSKSTPSEIASAVNSTIANLTRTDLNRRYVGS